MENLELMIVGDDEGQQIQPIEFNYEELKTGLSNLLTVYREMTYTDETMATAKTDVASLRKLSKAINDKKIQVKKRCLKPYEDFELKIKDLLAMVDEPITTIDSQVKAYEEAKKAKKLEEARAYFLEVAESLKLASVIPWNVFQRDEYSLLSWTAKKTQEDINERLQGIRKDWDALAGQEADPFCFEMKEAYSRTLDLAEALDRGRLLKAEAERKAEYERIKAYTKPEVQNVAQSIAEADGLTFPKEEAQSEQRYFVSFRVSGTKAQLQALSEFLRSSGIQFEKI